MAVVQAHMGSNLHWAKSLTAGAVAEAILTDELPILENSHMSSNACSAQVA